MADVENPARVSPQVTSDCGLDVGPRHGLRIDRLLDQQVVEEAGSAVAIAVHRDEAQHALAGIERLRQPPRIACNLFGRGGAGHAAP